METYYIKEYIKETQALLGKKKIVGNIPFLFLSALCVLLSVATAHNMFVAVFVVGYNIALIVAFLVGIIFGKRDWLVLGEALVYTGLSAIFAVMGFYAFTPDKMTVLCCLALYMVACILQVISVRRSVRSGRHFAKGRTRTKPIPRIWLSIPGVAIGQVIARVMAGALSYETNKVIFLCLVILFVFLPSLGSDLYLCFYYMRKHKVR